MKLARIPACCSAANTCCGCRGLSRKSTMPELARYFGILTAALGETGPDLPTDGLAPTFTKHASPCGLPEMDVAVRFEGSSPLSV